MNLTKSIPCGDWWLGWGYGGRNKIGKLTKNPDETFVWKGYSQGRHGSKWNYGAYLHFRIFNDKVEVIEKKGSVPVHSELIKAAMSLM